MARVDNCYEEITVAGVQPGMRCSSSEMQQGSHTDAETSLPLTLREVMTTRYEQGKIQNAQRCLHLEKYGDCSFEKNNEHSRKYINSEWVQDCRSKIVIDTDNTGMNLYLLSLRC